MIHSWKRALLEGATGVFERGSKKAPDNDVAAIGREVIFIVVSGLFRSLALRSLNPDCGAKSLL